MENNLTVNVGEAKTQLSHLIHQAESGIEVIIARNGIPAVKLQPVATRRPQFGFLADIHIPDEVLFAPLAEHELREWEDGPMFPAAQQSDNSELANSQ